MPFLDCANSNATCPARDQQVAPNPDVAGVGVIAGFLAMTGLAFFAAFAILFLDRYEEIRTFCRKQFKNNDEPFEHDDRRPYWRSPHFWSRVLRKNLLALSDTQLVTGLAIQFSAMIKHCELSVYHFRIAIILAFLTSITTLLTLVALRDYFVKNKWINLPRVIIMIGNLAMLGYTTFITYSYGLSGLDLTSSLACWFKGGQAPLNKATFRGKWAILLCGALGGHGAVILAMYILHDEKHEALKRVGAVFRTWILAPGYAIYGLYMALTELLQTAALGTPPVLMDGDEKEWGFGQLLPLMLIALPIFAGYESFWEEKGDPEERWGPSRRPSSTNMLKDAPSNNLELTSRDASVAERGFASSVYSPLASPAATLMADPMASMAQRSVSSPTILTVASPIASPQVQQRSQSFQVTTPTS